MLKCLSVCLSIFISYLFIEREREGERKRERFLCTFEQFSMWGIPSFWILSLTVDASFSFSPLPLAARVAFRFGPLEPLPTDFELEASNTEMWAPH